MEGEPYWIIGAGGDSEKVQLDAHIGGGGAGNVWSVRRRPNDAIKLYKNEVLGDYENKVRAMLHGKPDFGAVEAAWPSHVVENPQGIFRGFLMPKFDSSKYFSLEEIIIKPIRTAKNMPPHPGFRFYLAINLALAIVALHKQGHAFIDLKPRNLLGKARDATVLLLDCDGFNIRSADGKHYIAKQATQDYTAPEFRLMSKNRRNAPAHLGNLGVSQDNFALAVIIFQLLNDGIHPFDGKSLNDKVPSERQIKINESYYPYGLSPHPQILPSPFSLIEDFPQPIRQLFDQAFSSRDRPKAKEWGRALRGLESTISDCPNDQTHLVLSTKCLHCEAKKRRPSKSVQASPATPGRQTILPPTIPPVAPVPAPGTIAWQRRPVSLASAPPGQIVGPIGPVSGAPASTSTSTPVTWRDIWGLRLSVEFTWMGLFIILILSSIAFLIGLIFSTFFYFQGDFIEWRFHLLCVTGVSIFVMFTLSPLRWWPVEEFHIPVLKDNWTWGNWGRFGYSVVFLILIAPMLAEAAAPQSHSGPYAYWLIGAPVGVAWQSLTVWFTAPFFQLGGQSRPVYFRFLFYGYWLFLAFFFTGIVSNVFAS
ncbi:MAG: hypothetical protein QGH37_32575 [Candidatus Poribacteria bacterium]|jgi:serine/threonine protein kinase|nr:hypothetical protein [Candidatus Poribacteria bacterium]